MRNFYLQTLEGVPRLGQTREEIVAYFNSCYEKRSDDPGTWDEIIFKCFEDVAEAYGVDNVPQTFWDARNLGRSAYIAIDRWNAEHPDEEPGEIVKKEEEGAMEENVDLGPQVVSAEQEFFIIDEDENTITYQDETGKMYVEPKPKSSGLGWIVAAAAAFLLLG